MRAVTRWWFIGVSVSLLCSGAVAQGKSDTTSTPSRGIADRMEQAQSGARPTVSYQVVREYRLSGSSDSRSDSDVVAEVDFRPPAIKNYRIQKSSGNGRGLQVVRRLLDHEVDAASNQGRAAFTKENYDFGYIGETNLDGQRCYLLEMKAKRKETDLIDGQVWVDEHSFAVRRIEGELAKSPSWWLKRVSVQLSFSELGGVWLQTSMEARADVRVAGPHTLSSRTLDYRPANDVASVGPSIRSANHKP